MVDVALALTRVYLALDASAVTAASLADGVSGHKLRTLAHEPLPTGALAPGATGSNLQDAEAVRAAIGRALAALGRARVTLVLPDGTARLVLVEPPRGISAREYVRYRLAASLPWAAEQASFETLDAGSGRVIGAAIRRATVAEYEQAVVAAGAAIEQVHLAPLLALARLLRERGRDRAHALLGDVAMCLALVRDGSLVALRSRRRDRSPGEAARLRTELERLAAGAARGNGDLPLAVSGAGAASLRPQLGAQGLVADAVAGEPGANASGARAEAAWLVALIA